MASSSRSDLAKVEIKSGYLKSTCSLTDVREGIEQSGRVKIRFLLSYDGIEYIILFGKVREYNFY